MKRKTNIKQLNHKRILELLNTKDKRVVFEKTNIIPDHRQLYSDLKRYIKYEQIPRKSVLGIDMYQYSSLGEFEQTLVPFLFK